MTPTRLTLTLHRFGDQRPKAGQSVLVLFADGSEVVHLDHKAGLDVWCWGDGGAAQEVDDDDLWTEAPSRDGLAKAPPPEPALSTILEIARACSARDDFMTTYVVRWLRCLQLSPDCVDKCNCTDADLDDMESLVDQADGPVTVCPECLGRRDYRCREWRYFENQIPEGVCPVLQDCSCCPPCTTCGGRRVLPR